MAGKFIDTKKTAFRPTTLKVVSSAGNSVLLATTYCKYTSLQAVYQITAFSGTTKGFILLFHICSNTPQGL